MSQKNKKMLVVVLRETLSRSSAFPLIHCMRQQEMLLDGHLGFSVPDYSLAGYIKGWLCTQLVKYTGFTLVTYPEYSVELF